MSKILIVDDEKLIRDLIVKYAINDNLVPDTAENGEEAILKVRNNNYDLVIMDVMMPVLDGFRAVKEIRKDSNVPIIMLSARSEEYDKLYGFDLGIDDYVTKPFSPKELLMRIHAVINRYQAKDKVEEDKIFSYEDLIINYSAHKVLINNELLELTLKEYELLTYLVEHFDNYVTREELIKNIWGNMDSNDRTLDTHIKSLRKKIGKYGENIVTLRRVGYRFENKQN